MYKDECWFINDSYQVVIEIEEGGDLSFKMFNFFVYLAEHLVVRKGIGGPSIILALF